LLHNGLKGVTQAIQVLGRPWRRP